MYVWRIPVLLFSPLITTALLLGVCAALLAWRHSVRSGHAKGILLALTIVALASSPIAVTGFINGFAARGSGIMRTYIHPATSTLWLPAVAAPAMLLLAHRLFPYDGMMPKVCVRYRLAFFSTALVFALLNVVNWCSPGWCERYGFPLPYWSWSDSIVIVNGENLTADVSVVALVANVLLLALVGYAMFNTYERRRPTPYA